ncbi:apolipoprotein N-acyltransferase [Actinoplanes ianthinogenes]|uniref:Apolipoprotein N-acyltransferase n=1 Tax=Actinoplanes ianthinogenes TaxID=122358 RepID=A0ABN6C3Q4_9ACTN|nr:nitrilase-related carbon-nitrogen hydrolase [Actinoplanes ianthinogenes]BCJ39748.1 apolipoprotein N-acyltransferase [Actinoplanes ianthinogenes]GGR47653.1 apolipoprotein N-acyltransferase [Actinoplanes ianthinogenes]
MSTIVAAALSALLWLGGYGLQPLPILTWLAPLPLLVLAAFAHRKALFATLLAWPLGQLAMATYYHRTLQIPLPVVIAFVLYGTALATGTIGLAGALLRRGRTATAILATPALWVLGEYTVSLLMPNGAWWSLAYTQADVRPIIQLTALTGVWGVTYLLLATPIALAALLTAGKRATRTKPALACLLALTVTTAGWATWSLTRPSAATGKLRVGLVALEQTEDGLPLDQPSGQELLARYLPRVQSLAGQGATIVVLPEKVFTASPQALAAAFRPVTNRGVQVIVGAVQHDGGTARNVAVVLGPAVRTYAKQHLIKGLEDDWLTPGDDDLIVDGRYGIAICKDLDFPDLTRRYRAHGATMLLVPALDFTGDGWLHSRMAVVRGVETGTTVVRAAAFGRLTVSGPTGRLLGEATAGDAQLLVTVAPSAPGTFYGRTGNWFLIFSLVLVLMAGRRATRRRPGARGPRSATGRLPSTARPR